MRRGLTRAAGVFDMCIECCGGKCAAEAVLCGIDRRSGSQGGRAAAAQIMKKRRAGCIRRLCRRADDRHMRSQTQSRWPELSGFGMGFRLSERPIKERRLPARIDRARIGAFEPARVYRRLMRIALPMSSDVSPLQAGQIAGTERLTDPGGAPPGRFAAMFCSGLNGCDETNNSHRLFRDDAKCVRRRGSLADALLLIPHDW